MIKRNTFLRDRLFCKYTYTITQLLHVGVSRFDQRAALLETNFRISPFEDKLNLSDVKPYRKFAQILTFDINPDSKFTVRVRFKRTSTGHRFCVRRIILVRSACESDRLIYTATLIPLSLTKITFARHSGIRRVGNYLCRRRRALQSHGIVNNN